jgi:hypothetical protein
MIYLNNVDFRRNLYRHFNKFFSALITNTFQSLIHT